MLVFVGAQSVHLNQQQQWSTFMLRENNERDHYEELAGVAGRKIGINTTKHSTQLSGCAACFQFFNACSRIFFFASPPDDINLVVSIYSEDEPLEKNLAEDFLPLFSASRFSSSTFPDFFSGTELNVCVPSFCVYVQGRRK